MGRWPGSGIILGGEVIMRDILLTLCAAILLAASPHTQTRPRTEEQLKASFEAHKGDFDYLLGDWEFTAKSQELDKVVGLKNVDVIHCNDSVTGLGSNRDRHANIGAGQIGEDGFRALLHEPRLDRLPFVLEVPGAGEGPDAEQVETLKRLASS